MLFVDGELNSVSQKNFEEYLTKGAGNEFHTSLLALSNEQFLKLEEIVNEWESYPLMLEAFCSERLKRFNRSG